MHQQDESTIVVCPKCRKKFRIKKIIRFQCKYCSTLIDPSLQTSLTAVEETPFPVVLQETKEELIGTFEDLNRKFNLRFLPIPGYFFKKLAYWYDNFVSRGPVAMFLTLVFLFIVAWIVCVTLFWLFAPPQSLGQQLWITLLQICDPGSMGEIGANTLVTRMLTFVTSMLGVVIFSLLIAFLTNIFDQKLQELKKGHTLVMEEEHTLILGWSDKVVSILAELIMANESQSKTAVVILSTRAKEELDDYLRVTVKERFKTRIIVRCGEISNIGNLDKVNISGCRSIIIVSEIDKSASRKDITLNDTQIIKTILSICKNPARRPDPFNIVTELGEPKNVDIARSIGQDEVTIFYSNEIIAKILVQTSRQNGLATVYNELLSFAGHEIYCVNESQAYGKSIREILYDFPECVPIGVQKLGHPATINPPHDTLIMPGDQIIVIAEDSSTIYYQKSSLTPGRFRLPEGRKAREPHPERQLLLGWNAKSESIIREYGDYLCEGSEIVVVAPTAAVEIKATVKKLQNEIPKIKLRLIEKDYRLREELEKIVPFSYDNIIILASELDGNATVEEIDSHTIYTLLLLRDMNQKSARASETKLITELLNPANQELIQIAKVNDVVISNQLISMMLAQVSQQKAMYQVYHDLFRAEGSEIYLKSAYVYFERLPVEVSFHEIMGVVLQRKEIAFGYRINRWAQRGDLNFGIKLNPDKQKKILLDQNDQIIVVAEDEF